MAAPTLEDVALSDFATPTLSTAKHKVPAQSERVRAKSVSQHTGNNLARARARIQNEIQMSNGARPTHRICSASTNSREKSRWVDPWPFVIDKLHRSHRQIP